MTPACCCWPCCWMRCPRLMKTSAVWGHVGCLPSVSLSSVAAPAPLLASITVIQIRNLTEQTIKGCSSALGTTQSCLRRCGLTQCAYTLTPQTHQWMAFLRSVFAEARAIKAQHTATSRKDRSLSCYFPLNLEDFLFSNGHKFLYSFITKTEKSTDCSFPKSVWAHDSQFSHLYRSNVMLLHYGQNYNPCND